MSLTLVSHIDSPTSGELPPLVTGDTFDISTPYQPNMSCLNHIRAETRRNRLNRMGSQNKRRRHYKKRHINKYRQHC